MAIGGEQLVHFNHKTDTDRDIYVTFSKGWWENEGSANPELYKDFVMICLGGLELK